METRKIDHISLMPSAMRYQEQEQQVIDATEAADMEKESENERDLQSLIEENVWDRVYERILEKPDTAKQIVNVSLGWYLLHWLCSIGSAPLELIQLVASVYPEAITAPDRRYGDTPLHIVCRNSQTSSQKMKVLLQYLGDNREGVLIRNIFGGTALHSASNHNALLEVLQLLVECNPRILRVTTLEGIHAVGALWHSYIQTIPGFMIVARMIEGEEVSEGHFDRFWKKVEYLSRQYFYLTRDQSLPADDSSDYTLHGLLLCNVAINMFKVALKRNPAYAWTPDNDGNLPIHKLLETRPYRLKEKDAIESVLRVAPQTASRANSAGDFPLLIAIRNRIPWENGVDKLLEIDSTVVYRRDPTTGLYPYLLAASIGGKFGVETTFHLLLSQPDLLQR